MSDKPSTRNSVLTWQFRIANEIHIPSIILVLLSRGHQIVIFIQRQVQFQAPYLCFTAADSRVETVIWQHITICNKPLHKMLHCVMIQEDTAITQTIQKEHKYTRMISRYIIIIIPVTNVLTVTLLVNTSPYFHRI